MCQNKQYMVKLNIQYRAARETLYHAKFMELKEVYRHLLSIAASQQAVNASWHDLIQSYCHICMAQPFHSIFS
jgi:hypothetical protein